MKETCEKCVAIWKSRESAPWQRVTPTALNAYILQMESQGLSAATISRTVTALKRFFDFLCKHEGNQADPAEWLKAPRVERKSVRTASSLALSGLEQMEARGEKQLRDKAMMLALCQGVRASEAIGLELGDVNLEFGYLMLRGNRHSRTLPMGSSLTEAIRVYLEKARPALLHGKESESVFINCLGGAMSRQSVWKIVRRYGQEIGIADLTPTACVWQLPRRIKRPGFTGCLQSRRAGVRSRPIPGRGR